MKYASKHVVSIALALGLTGCAVGDQPYPANWDPVSPASTADCAAFRGSYADRGETAGHATDPSLTRELFGNASDWKDATRVEFSQPTSERIDVAVWRGEQKSFTRHLTRQAGEIACQSGRLVLRNKRWMATDTISGREAIIMEFDRTGNYLVGRLTETTYGVLFAVVPVAAESKRWYRFRRLTP
jgi:hypothetical protein